MYQFLSWSTDVDNWVLTHLNVVLTTALWGSAKNYETKLRDASKLIIPSFWTLKSRIVLFLLLWHGHCVQISDATHGVSTWDISLIARRPGLSVALSILIAEVRSDCFLSRPVAGLSDSRKCGNIWTTRVYGPLLLSECNCRAGSFRLDSWTPVEHHVYIVKHWISTCSWFHVEQLWLKRYKGESICW